MHSERVNYCDLHFGFDCWQAFLRTSKRGYDNSAEVLVVVEAGCGVELGFVVGHLLLYVLVSYLLRILSVIIINLHTLLTALFDFRFVVNEVEIK